MKAALQMLLGLMAFAGMMATAAHAQAPTPPAVPEGPRYIVVYLEVMPTATAGAVTLVRRFRDGTRKEDGNLRAEALQRIGQLNQFVLLEAWKDQAATEPQEQPVEEPTPPPATTEATPAPQRVEGGGTEQSAGSDGSALSTSAAAPQNGAH